MQKLGKQAKAGIKGLEGELSKKINFIREKLLNMMADIEVSIDYPEYDVPEFIYQKEIKELKDIELELIKLENSFERGKILTQGVKTAIIGKPNAGKSSLLNTLLKEERAIVSDIEGTTRDTIEEIINVEGIPLKIIDTAGIRKSDDFVENIGVKKAKEIANESDLIIAIFDNSKDLTDGDEEILEIIKEKNAIILLNKIDLEDKELDKKIELKQLNKKIIKISTKTGEGIENLYEEIISIFGIHELEIDNSVFITNVRHKNQINKSINDLKEVMNDMVNNIPIDIISIKLKEVLEDLGEITGENVSEDIINKIFSKFCLGK